MARSQEFGVECHYGVDRYHLSADVLFRRRENDGDCLSCQTARGALNEQRLERSIVQATDSETKTTYNRIKNGDQKPSREEIFDIWESMYFVGRPVEVVYGKGSYTASLEKILTHASLSRSHEYNKCQRCGTPN